MPLLAELLKCLSAYTETFQGILTCIASACDSTPRKHDSPIILQVQDLLNIDTELRRHLKHQEEWETRQKTIKELEDRLNVLTTRINNFEEILSSTKRNLEYCVKSATKMQKEARKLTIEE